MTGLDLLSHAAGQAGPQIIYATVALHQPVPVGFDDPLYVVEPHRPTDYKVIHGWPAIHGNTKPSAGADVTLVRDSIGALRCVWWAGTHS